MDKTFPPFSVVAVEEDDPNTPDGRASAKGADVKQRTDSVTIRSPVPANRVLIDPASTPTWVPKAYTPGPALRPAAGQRHNVVVISDGAVSSPATRPVTGASVAAPATVSSPGAFRVGPYEVATRIARGGTASVYVCRRANAPGPQRLLTLKAVRQHSPEQERAIRAFQHEALIGSLFSHPHAQTVLETDLYQGEPFLILDYVDGGSLADLLAPETRPSPAVVVAIVLDALAALQALHVANDADGNWLGLIHCDISPENILIGVNGVARLADFGSTRFIATDKQAQAFGLSKPPCMPPEQLRGDKLDTRSDIYAMGVLLWTALTGQQPFAADTYEQTAMNVLRKKIKPPSAHGAPACLDDVCMQAMDRSPDGRFMVATAMATALLTAARAENLIDSREGVGRWVRGALGDVLASRHRRIEAAFDRRG